MLANMEQEEKDDILEKAKKHVAKTCSVIDDSKTNVKESIEKKKAEYKTMSPADQLVFTRLLAHDKARVYELDHLKNSPYFVKCTVVLDDSGEEETWFFGKFGYNESDIYSWITPAASIRFEKPGEFSYQPPDEKIVRGKLVAKDQYMIVDKKIIFLATESLSQDRELIYQEHFSSRKNGFVLPEIVAQMEKAQDQVVRADYKGPFVISGPAGSGKTTLALHRIAYLVQSPETADFVSPESIIVFVQDEGTKDYFSHLLPELGIKNVKITTFSLWAMDVLGLEGFTVEDQFGESEDEKDTFEKTKLRVLKEFKAEDHIFTKKIFDLLEQVYTEQLNDTQMALFVAQRKNKQLDRFDLTILLKIFLETNGELTQMREYFLELENGKLKKKVGRLPIGYSLVLVDEFQNYLPEQIALMKTCKKEKQQSMLYVGDIAQQIQIGTIRDFKEVDEQVEEERLVELNKVYRNTQEILSYIKSLGYPVSVPKEITKGSAVEQVVLGSKEEEIAYVDNLIKSLEGNQTIGVLSRHQEYLSEFEKAFEKEKNVRIFDIKESQGVEFDIVCLVGVDEHAFIDNEGDTEKQRILKNLLYIALTRAMTQLYVLGKEKLKRFE
jgi:DNA helicase IV